MLCPDPLPEKKGTAEADAWLYGVSPAQGPWGICFVSRYIPLHDNQSRQVHSPRLSCLLGGLLLGLLQLEHLRGGARVGHKGYVRLRDAGRHVRAVWCRPSGPTPAQ